MIDVDRLVSLAAAGGTAAQIARDLGCTRATVYRHAVVNRISLASTVVTKVDRAEMLTLYGGGVGCGDLARRYGCSYSTIYHHLRSAGYRPGRSKAAARKTYTSAEDRRIVKTIRALATLLDRSPDQVVDHARYLFARVPRVKGTKGK